MRMSRDERVIYDRYLMDRAILRNTVDGARDEGRFEGMKEGMEKGRQQGLQQGLQQCLQQCLQQEKLNNARKMKARGYSLTDIADITGLTHEEIERL